MKRVKFIKSLNIEEHCLYDNDEYFQYMVCKPLNFVDMEPAAFLETDDIIEHVVIPITDINQCVFSPTPENPHKTVTTTTFIAHSKEVEDLLEMPFKFLHEQINGLQRKIDEENGTIYRLSNSLRTAKEGLSDYATADVWNRLKYLFTGRIE